jgi:erythromycin esterase
MAFRPKLSRRALLAVAGAAAAIGGGWAAVGSARRNAVEGAVLPWFKANSQAFDPARLDSLWSPAMAAQLAGARIIGLGEATHGSHEDITAKAALVKGLVASGQVTALYLESNAPGGRQLDAFIAGEPGDPAERLRSAKVFRVIKSRPVADLLGWLRDWNRTAALPVRIFGIDCQATAQDAASALEALEALDPAVAAALAARLAPIVSAKAQALRFPVLIKSLTTAQLKEAMTALEALSGALKSRPGTAEARYAARTAWQGLKAFELETADGKITGDLAEYYSRRDRFMAENILKAPVSGGGVFWGHNMHVASGAPPGSSFLPTGGALRQTLGDGYRCVVFEYGEARFNAVPTLPLASSPSAADPNKVIHWSGKAGRLAGLLSKARAGSHWVPVKGLPDDKAGQDWRGLTYRLAWPGYAAVPSTALVFDVDYPCGRMFDIIVYLDQLTPSRPL